MKWISTGNVRAFVETVKAQMDSAKSSKGSTSDQTPDPIEQLERLGKLHSAGVLTDAEFESKKAEILARV